MSTLSTFLTFFTYNINVFRPIFGVNPKIYDIQIDVLFSSFVTTCHVCHGIFSASPRDAALTMPFATNMQHHRSKVWRLLCQIAMEISKVPRLAQKFQSVLTAA